MPKIFWGMFFDVFRIVFGIFLGYLHGCQAGIVAQEMPKMGYCTEEVDGIWVGYVWDVNGLRMELQFDVQLDIYGILMVCWCDMEIWMAGWEIPHEKRTFQWEHHRTTWVNFQQDIMVLGSVNLYWIMVYSWYIMVLYHDNIMVYSWYIIIYYINPISSWYWHLVCHSFCNTEKFHQDYAPRLPVSKGLILQLEKCWRTMRCIPPNRSNIHV